ncbi:hypothetical protein [Janthinobacterium sp. PSPC2-1]|uniref:hypothetical protein n=1 Tax=unclassified Janthinobacterium TaxID=2610881 RepID=UPI003CF13C8D
MNLMPEQQAVKDKSTEGRKEMLGVFTAALVAVMRLYREAVDDIGQMLSSAAGMAPAAGAAPGAAGAGSSAWVGTTGAATTGANGAASAAGASVWAGTGETAAVIAPGAASAGAWTGAAAIPGSSSAAVAAAGAIRPSAMPQLMQQIQARLNNLAAARNAALASGIDKAAEIGVRPFIGRISNVQLAAMRADAVRSVWSHVGPDKLKLSDRIWRIDRHANDIVRGAVQNAVVRGDGATQAARDFLAQGVKPPPELALAQEAGKVDSIKKAVSQGLLTGKGAPVDNAERVMRTELNRAHAFAYQSSAAADMDSIGTKFLLSPRHPRVDICDFHARANLHGLGPGVYPHGRSPLPAHPNTLSFEVIVYADEVTAADRKGKQTPTEFLATVASKDRKGILGANKNEAFEAGKLRATQIRSRWRDVKRRIDRQNELKP